MHELWPTPLLVAEVCGISNLKCTEKLLVAYNKETAASTLHCSTRQGNLFLNT